MSDEFFVGYLPTPPQAARRMRRTTAAIVVLVAAVATALALGTGPFDRSSYDYATVREWRGTLEAEPIPVLIAENGQRFPLVAQGKHGAAPALTGNEGRDVRLMGRRIVRDGTTMIELVPDTIERLVLPTPEAHKVDDLGPAQFSGEIVDSKCFLGVMNPGRLEVHRACAKRCIAGGIPPMLFTHDGAGRELHLLLVDASGRPVNDRVLPLVARPVTLEGRLERRDGLHYLYVSDWP